MAGFDKGPMFVAQNQISLPAKHIAAKNVACQWQLIKTSDKSHQEKETPPSSSQASQAIN